jgi:hypothetical protein
VAAQPPQLAVLQPQQIAALEARAARLDAAGARQQAKQRQRGDALAAAGLANDPERLAGRDVE